MKETDNKILIGSISSYLDKKLILGDSVDSKSIVLLNILIDNYNYALSQLENGDDRYNEIVQILSNKILDLRNHCPEICIYKNRLIYFVPNTPPRIENNTIRIPILSDLYDINRREVIKNYFDRENDGISEITFLTKSNEVLNFQVSGRPVVLNNSYSASTTNFKAKYDVPDGKKLLIFNTGTDDNCVPNAVLIDENRYNELTTENNISYFKTNGTVNFQKVIDSIDELPNDTIIYIHIDTSSMAVPDQQTIQQLALEWWGGFKTANPNFQGALLVNTVANDVLGNNPAPGRNAAGKHATPGFRNTSVEAWLNNPIEGIARNAYRDGTANFANEQALLNYCQNKSLVVLTFVDETDSEYHRATPGSFSGQPTPSYIADYNNFILKLRPKLKFFKGVLYPITKVNNSYNDTFLLHGIAAIEGRNLYQTEIDNLLGPAVVAAYGSNMQTKFYTPLQNNPYSIYGKLKENGWQGNFTKTSPASAVLQSQEFATELNTILTDTSTVQTTSVENTPVVAQNLGTDVTENVTLKVKDNNVNPLESNVAQLNINFFAVCEEVETCNGSKDLQIEHREDYTFSESDFSLASNEDKIKITSVTVAQGELKYLNLNITNSILPLVIKKADLGKLKYISDRDFQTANTINITYKKAKQGSFNYCKGNTQINLTKKENPNKPPTVTIAPKSLQATTVGQIFNNQTLDATVNYNGAGGYTVGWVQLAGPSTTLGNATVEDLVVSGLTHGNNTANNYTYRITVVTNVDGFTATADITVPVTIVNQAPTVNAGPDQSKTTLTPNTETIALTATESDYNNNITTRQWTQVSGPNTATISSANTLSTNITGMVIGTYVFRITVTDSGNLSASDDVQIAMVQQNRPPVIQPITVNNITLPSNGVSITPQVTDPDNNLSTVVWTKVSGPAATIVPSGNLGVVGLNNLVEGNYVFRITATDALGLTATQDISFTVNPPVNTPPTVQDSNVNLPTASNNEVNLTMTTAQFTNNYQDAESHNYKKTTIVSLPAAGQLLYNNTPITAGYEFLLSNVSNLTYKATNVKTETDGTFVYTEDINARITQLTSQGYIQQSYSNGVYVFNKLSPNLINSNVDGTFDTLPGVNNAFNGNVTGAGWKNGSGSADSVAPNPTDNGTTNTGTYRPGIGCPASPQGGVYAGAISIGTDSGEEFYTEISTVAGGKYRVTFYQTFAGDNVQTYPLNTAIPWKVSLGPQTLLSTPNPWLGFQNQVWTEQVLEFTAASTSSTTKLSFKAGVPSGASNGVRYGYLGCDHVRIQQVLESTTDTVTLTGTKLTNQTIRFKTSDDGPGELYSNEQTLTLNA